MEVKEKEGKGMKENVMEENLQAKERDLGRNHTFDT